MVHDVWVVPNHVDGRHPLHVRLVFQHHKIRLRVRPNNPKLHKFLQRRRYNGRRRSWVNQRSNPAMVHPSHGSSPQLLRLLHDLVIRLPENPHSRLVNVSLHLCRRQRNDVRQHGRVSYVRKELPATAWRRDRDFERVYGIEWGNCDAIVSCYIWER